VVVSASVESQDLKISINALRAARANSRRKPVEPLTNIMNVWPERLCTQLADYEQVKVIRQRFNDTTGKR